MKMFSVVRYISSQQKVSSKGNQYRISNFVQEDSAVLTCVDKSDLNLDFGEEIQAIFEYNPKYQTLSFVGIQ